MCSKLAAVVGWSKLRSGPEYDIAMLAIAHGSLDCMVKVQNTTRCGPARSKANLVCLNQFPSGFILYWWWADTYYMSIHLSKHIKGCAVLV
jgi:hypothetical protein